MGRGWLGVGFDGVTEVWQLVRAVRGDVGKEAI